MQAFAPGIFPRSEALVQATRDLDRRRTSEEAVDAQVTSDREELISIQHEAGLDLISDGMLTWQDLFRPLLEASDGLEPGPLTRFLDTNTFYRAPHATAAEPKLAQPLEDAFVPLVDGPRVVTLPSPFALSHGTGATPQAIADCVLKPVLDAVDAELVVLSEPFLGRVAPERAQELAEPLESLRGGPKLALQLTFCDARAALESGLAELPVDGIGVDFYLTHLTDLSKRFDKLLLAGVVDARSSAVEDAGELAAFARRLQDEREVEQVALVPNGDLQFVAQPIALEKLHCLGAAKTATLSAENAAQVPRA
jgi:5-methyltetrahydropteroyltriglutamate--homocysteine methyltransferase